MEFSGSFELDDVSKEEVWLALSDPVLVEKSLPGCQFLVEIDEERPDFDALQQAAAQTSEEPPVLPDADPEAVKARSFKEGDRYAALLELGVGSVKPSFKSIVTVTEREYPTMEATGEGSAANSSFTMTSGMTLKGTEKGVIVEWWSETDVMGRVAQMGKRVLNPVANRVVNKFFDQLADQLKDVDDTSTSGRIRDLF